MAQFLESQVQQIEYALEGRIMLLEKCIQEAVLSADGNAESRILEYNAQIKLCKEARKQFNP